MYCNAIIVSMVFACAIFMLVLIVSQNNNEKNYEISNFNICIKICSIASNVCTIMIILHYMKTFNQNCLPEFCHSPLLSCSSKYV